MALRPRSSRVDELGLLFLAEFSLVRLARCAVVDRQESRHVPQYKVGCSSAETAGRPAADQDARTAVITAQVGSVPLWERPQLAGSYWNARTSCAHRHATAILAAHCSAASREGSSSTV